MQSEFIFLPADATEVETKGCVVDKFGNPIKGAQVVISYFSRVFMDREQELTDAGGCFDIRDRIKIFDQFIAQIDISKHNYQSYQIQRISDKNTPFLRLEMPIVLAKQYLQI